MVFDAEHRSLVSLAQKRTRRFPSGTSEDEWRLTRSGQADDVNAEVRTAVDQNGYSLFRIGLSPQP